MASKKAGKPKRNRKNASAQGDWKDDPDVLAILKDLEAAINEGLKDPDDPTDPQKAKVLHPDATDALKQDFGPRVQKRLHMANRPSWDDEKGEAKKDGTGPLSAAFRFGLLAFILSTGRIVSVEVAKVVGDAVRKDEHCRHSAGAGDWCT